MSRVLLAVDREDVDPTSPEVLHAWRQSAARLGREGTPPTYARRVRHTWGLTDSEGNALAVCSREGLEYGTGHAPVFPPPPMPTDIVDRHHEERLP